MAPLARGSIIVGNASGDPSALTVKGTADQVFTSDGTDAAWADLNAGTSWQATQAASFTAVAGNGYPCNTTAGQITVTMPSSATLGDTIELVDYAGTFDTNSLLISWNGLKYRGATTQKQIGTEDAAVTLAYLDATRGWVEIGNVGTDLVVSLFTATGGTESTYGGYKIHTFTSSANFVTGAYASSDIEVMATAGAGGGASQHSGGGGAGGYRVHNRNSSNC